MLPLFASTIVYFLSVTLQALTLYLMPFAARLAALVVALSCAIQFAHGRFRANQFGLFGGGFSGTQPVTLFERYWNIPAQTGLMVRIGAGPNQMCAPQLLQRNSHSSKVIYTALYHFM